MSDIAAGLLQYRPALDQHGSNFADFEFQVHDDGLSSDIALTIDPSSNRIVFDVQAVNDAPQGSDGTVVLDEDTVHIFTPEQFGFNDASDSDDGHSFIAVQFTSPPAVGQLDLNGSSVSPGAVVSVADISAALLRYTPPDNAYGNVFAVLDFRVQDSGGTANAGNDFSVTANSLILDVLPVDDPPVLQPILAGEVSEGESLILQRDQLLASDVDTDAEFLNYQINNPFQHGSLMRNGEVVSTFTQADIDAGSMVYRHHGDEIFADSMQFTLTDSASVGFDSSLEITILPVNDHAPVALVDTISVTQGDTTSQLSSGAVTVLANDTDADLPVAQLQATLAITPEHGSVTLNLDGSFSYQHDGSANYSDTFTYLVHDGSVGAPGVRVSEGTVQVTISPRNVAPVAEPIMPQSTSTAETFLFPIPDDTFSDTDPDDELTLSASQANGDALPVWLSFDPATGVFSGTPDASDTGTITVAVTAMDEAGIAVTTLFEITVEPMLGPAAPVQEFAAEELSLDVSPARSVAMSGESGIENSRFIIVKPAAIVAQQPASPTMALQPQDRVMVNNTVKLTLADPGERRLSNWQDTAVFNPTRDNDIAQVREEIMSALNPVDRELHQQLALWLDETWQRDAEQGASSDTLLAGISVALSAGISVGYIVWLLRSELLLASVLSAMPAWRLVDPVPVLNSVSDADHDESDESLSDLVAESEPPAPEPPVPERPQSES